MADITSAILDLLVEIDELLSCSEDNAMKDYIKVEDFIGSTLYSRKLRIIQYYYVPPFIIDSKDSSDLNNLMSLGGYASYTQSAKSLVNKQNEDRYLHLLGFQESDFKADSYTEFTDKVKRMVLERRKNVLAAKRITLVQQLRETLAASSANALDINISPAKKELGKVPRKKSFQGRASDKISEDPAKEKIEDQLESSAMNEDTSKKKRNIEDTNWREHIQNIHRLLLDIGKSLSTELGNFLFVMATNKKWIHRYSLYFKEVIKILANDRKNKKSSSIVMINVLKVLKTAEDKLILLGKLKKEAITSCGNDVEDNAEDVEIDSLLNTLLREALRLNSALSFHIFLSYNRSPRPRRALVSLQGFFLD